MKQVYSCQYKRRDGQIAECHCQIGRWFVVSVNGGMPHAVEGDGMAWNGLNSPGDLIAEWREPRTFERHIMFYETPGQEPCAMVARKPPVLDIDGKVLARGVIKLTEGEGMGEVEGGR